MERKIASNLKEAMFCKLRTYKKKKEILKYLSKMQDEEVQPVIEWLSAPFVKLSLLPYQYLKKYQRKDVFLQKDADGVYYVDVNGVSMYLKHSCAYLAKGYYNGILMEQDVDSPHCYTTDTFQPEEGEIILDVGGAEGYFPIKYLDKVKKVYIFECDKAWVNVLKKTYKDYSDKVEIIEKFVDSYSDEKHISLDDFIEEQQISNERLFIKMDVEGAETNVIAGGKRLFDSNQPIKLAICVYHFADHEQSIRSAFSGWNIETSKGYIFNFYDYEFAEPYIRRGVLRISNIEE